MRGSILLSLVTALLVVGVVGFGMVRRETGRSLRANLTQEFDDALVAKARALTPLVEFEDGRYEFEAAHESAPAVHADVFEVRTPDGEILARSPGASVRVPTGRGGWEPFFWDVPSPAGEVWRCVATRIPVVVDAEAHDDAPAGEEPGAIDLARAVDAHGPDERFALVVLGASRTRLDARVAAVTDTMDDSLWALGLFMLLAVLGALLVTWRALRGVARNVRAAPAHRLGPIDWDPAPPRELRPLTQALDDALAQAGAAVERERDVIAGMAHELRTPVAEMLATAEIALDDAARDGALRPALAEVRQVALQMKSTVETMLTVARGKAPDDVAALEDVDVVALWNTIAAAVSAKAAARSVIVERADAPAAPVRTDPAALRIVLTTLAENAALHAPRGSRVRVTARSEHGSVRLEVANPAPHLVPEDVARIGEPLWHKTGDGVAHRGLGLGLYLASEVARHANLALTHELRDGQLVATLVVAG